MEIWKDIEGFPGYQVSNDGNVRSFRDYHGNITDNSRILKPVSDKDGYLFLSLYTLERKQTNKRVHRLVADAFLGHQVNKVINHIDGNKQNNNLYNLEWVTAEENSTLAANDGLYKTRPVRVVETGEIFRSVKDCAKAVDVHPSDINHVISGALESIKSLHFEYLNDEESEKILKPKRRPFLRDYQMDAVKRMKNGCILNGSVGSGKSRTGLYYYFSKYGGSFDPDYKPMRMNPPPPDLYIITTAKKRNTLEWDEELVPFLLYTDPDKNSYYGNKVVVESWNNLHKFVNVKNAFFVLDEDHVTGKGAWVKAFLKIAKNNEWIILSASPADQWIDFVPVFIANGFFKSRSEFDREHVVYSRFTKYPKIERYENTGYLMKLRNQILVDMDYQRPVNKHHEDVFVQYDVHKYKNVIRNRWNPFTNTPIINASEFCSVLRRIVNSDESRQVAILELFERHPKVIIFYNFIYEVEILKTIFGAYDDAIVAQYNGQQHDPLPTGDKWVYLVQYNLSEGWNAVSTDTVIFYSQTYSYKTMLQAAGRVDRMNSPFEDLYYYHLKSSSGIDLAISKALKEKKTFNESRWAKW